MMMNHHSSSEGLRVASFAIFRPRLPSQCSFPASRPPLLALVRLATGDKPIMERVSSTSSFNSSNASTLHRFSTRGKWAEIDRQFLRLREKFEGQLQQEEALDFWTSGMEHGTNHWVFPVHLHFECKFSRYSDYSENV